MHHYPFHVGDYISSTAHLTIEEDCAYRRILDLYYQTEKPIPNNPTMVARLIRMRGHETLIESILMEFFTLDGIDFHHSRCDAELLKYKAMTDGGRNGAAKRWAKESNREAIPPLSPPHADPIGGAYSNQEPRTINQEPVVKSIAANRGKQLPPDFEPNEDHTSFAGLNGLRMSEVFEEFKDYHTARGSVMKDWNAALRTWLRNAVKFAKKDSAPTKMDKQQDTLDKLTGRGKYATTNLLG